MKKLPNISFEYILVDVYVCIQGGYDQSNNVVNENEVPNLSLYGEVSITRDSAADSIKSEDSSVRRKKHISRRLWARFDEEQKSNFQGETINTSTTYFSCT